MMGKVAPLLVVVVMCAGCEAKPDARVLATPAPCVLDEENVRGFPLYAKSCPLIVDGRAISPDTFNTWARVSIVAQPVDPRGWYDDRREYLERFAQEWIVEQGLAASGIELSEDEVEMFLLIGLGTPEERVRKRDGITGDHRSAEEVDEMWLRSSRRFAFACRLKGCTPSEDVARAYYDANLAASGVTYEESRREVFSDLYLSVRYDAYREVVEEMMKRHDVEFLLDELVVPTAEEGRER